MTLSLSPGEKETKFFGGFFPFPLFLFLGGLSFRVYPLQSAAPEAPAVPRGAGEEARFVPSPAFRGFIFFARVASVLLPFWRGGASPGALILGCRALAAGRAARVPVAPPGPRSSAGPRPGRPSRLCRAARCGGPRSGAEPLVLSLREFRGRSGASPPPGCSGAQRMRLRLGEPVRARGVTRAGGRLRASLSGSVSELGRSGGCGYGTATRGAR